MLENNTNTQKAPIKKESSTFVGLYKLFYLAWEKMVDVRLEQIHPDKAHIFFDKCIISLDHGINKIHCPQENMCTHGEPY